MFSDTLTIAHDAGDLVYNKINQDAYSSEYLFRDGLVECRLKIRNTSFKDKARGNLRVDRHNVELTGIIWKTAEMSYDIMRKAYAVIEIDSNDDAGEANGFFLGLVAFLTETNLAKLSNFES
jgi:hypothetical protein